MTITKFRIGLATLLVLGIAALFAIVGRAANSLPPGEYDLEVGQYVFNVLEPVPTNTPVPDPTDTPVPPTDTPVPPTDIPPTDVPPAHDDRAWHPVTADISHEHKDDPRYVDDVFGMGFFDIAGGELSYPWQTFRPPGGPGNMENDIKHEGYGWVVRRDLPGNITDFRLEQHGIMAPAGAQTRRHSFYLEARIKNPDGSIGFVRTGGWSDFCQLVTNDNFGNHTIVSRDGCTAPDSFAAKRLHSESNPGATWYNGQADNLHQFATFVLRTDDAWSPINPDNPAELNFFCPEYDCPNNSSTLQILDLVINIVPGSGGIHLDPDYDGVLNYSGYTNRYGVVVEGCTEAGLDCVPLELENVTTNIFSFSGTEMREYDVSPDGEWWIEYPN